MTRIKRDIIDNTTDKITMQNVINSEIPHTENLDISTGYFNVPGYAMLKDSLNDAIQKKNFTMRLLLGKQTLIPDSDFEEKAKQSGEDAVSLKSDLDDAKLTRDTMSDTSSLISFLKKESVQARLGSSRFNHSKCYILDDSVFIGSSNFTSGGLIGNYELNAGLYQPGVSKITREWFDRMWDVSEPTKEKLIELLESSKFGIPANPHDVYIKMIFEIYRDQLATDKDEQHYPVELASFQKDAVRTALFIISKFYGAMIADATGLGKTNMGMEILRQKILKENRKVLLIAPSQVLRSMWDKKLREAGLSVRIQKTMESLGRDDSMKWHEYKNIDFVLIDESQNFRSKNANRSINLARIMTIGKRKQALLLSATPINNSIMDLYYQISIFTQRDDTYFWRSIGIPDLYNHMREAANKEGGLESGLEKIQRLLDGVMVRRTRSYIQEVYKNDKINGQEIKFPKHEYSPIHYSLADLYGNVYERILADMHKLTMAPYGLEQYNTKAEDKEKARHLVLAHLQVILLLKRFESSIEAVKVSLDNKIKLYEHIVEAAKSGKMAKVKDFNKIIARGNYIINSTDSAEDSDNDFDMDKFIITEMEKLDKERIDKKYDIEKFKTDLLNDLKILEKLRSEMDRVTADKKLEAVRDVILKDKALDSDKKVLIFTEYTTTARYLLKKLKVQFPKNVIECITGITKSSTRSRYLERFAPKSNLADDQILEEKEIDILISTEVLAEGQNLQDCNYIINYDLPWNPMRIVQRIGRVDRLTSKHDTIHSRACYPDRDLDGILELMGKLLKKIQTVDKVIGLDSDLLGETPTPKQYNGHIRDRLKILGNKGQAASDVISTMGRNADLMPQNTPLSEITRWAKDTGINELRAMPMGRRSGKVGSKKKCILAYSREKPERCVYFVVYDYEKDTAHVSENECDAVNEARCIKDEPMYLPMDDDDDGAESFKELLRLDKKARQAIKENDDQIRKYDTKSKNTFFEKTRKDIKNILSNELKSGNIDSERLTHVSKILNRTELQAWESPLSDIISRYRDDNNVELLLKGVNDLGEQFRVKEEIVISNDKIDYESMNLIGAIFITPKDDNKKTGNDGLIKAVPAQTKLT